MNKTSIGWVRNPDGSQGYTHNPMSGCKNHTPDGLCLGGLFPCYAWKLAQGRLKPLYLANKNIATLPYAEIQAKGLEYTDIYKAIADPFYPRFWEGRLLELRGEGAYDNAYPDRNAYSASREKEKGIFVCDMGDLFGIGIPEQWTKRVLEQCKIFSQHRFYLLTKQPQNLIKFSPFPENCWVGVTVCNDKILDAAVDKLEDVQARIKFMSFEPLLERLTLSLDYALYYSGISWLIIGACTGTKKDMEELCKRYPDLTLMPYGKKWTAQPRIEWVREIVEAADKAGVKVFLKDNLVPLLSYSPDKSKAIWAYSDMGLRQEMPDGAVIPVRI